MSFNEAFYLSKLKEALSDRQRVNPNYSLRSFARYLRIDSSNLSAIIRKKRNLPPMRAKKIAKALKLSPKESALFVGSTFRKKMKLDKIQVEDVSKDYLLDEAYFHVIAEWEYYAFLQLLSTSGFQSKTEWVAKRLGVAKNRTDVVIGNLLKLGLVKRDSQGRFTRAIGSLETSEDVESSALQRSHFETLDMAKKKLHDVNVEHRDYSSITMAIDPDKLSEAKALIREFQDKLYALMTKGEKKEVYIFCSQFFPVTKRTV